MGGSLMVTVHCRGDLDASIPVTNKYTVKSQERCAEREHSMPAAQAVCFCICEVQEQAKLTCADRKQES